MKPDPYANGNIQNEFKMPFQRTIVSAVGHLHPGGLRDDIDLVRPGANPAATTSCAREATDASSARSAKVCVRATAGLVKDSVRIFRSATTAARPGRPGLVGRTLTASRPDWRVHVRQGDMLRITSTYDDGR